MGTKIVDKKEPTEFERLIAHYIQFDVDGALSGTMPEDEAFESLIQALHSQSTSLFDVKAQAIAMLVRQYIAYNELKRKIDGN
jgi:hypothetical protein